MKNAENTTATTITQGNHYYIMLDDCGCNIGSVFANNLKEATAKAKETRTPHFWKVKRCYGPISYHKTPPN
jgi:hypothetical protein